MHALFRCLMPLLGLSLVAAVPGCAAGGPAATEWRVLVKLAQPGATPDEVVQHAARASGATVLYLAAVSPQWHGLGLRCGDEAACRDAVDRLKADTSFFLTVERDERRRAHAPTPNPS